MLAALVAGLALFVAAPDATSVSMPVVPGGADRLTPVPFTSVKVTDGFWAPRLERNRTVTLPHALERCEATGRVANFEVAAGTKTGGMSGLIFNDSDVYKTLEAAAVILATKPDPALRARCDALVAKVAAAQEPDGYIYTPRTINDPKNPPSGGPERWSDMAMGHELYCMGHLYEAGVAYHEATGQRALLDVAIRSADLVAATFGPGKNTHPCGHPEIEIGLAKLYRHTGEKRYLDTLRFFIETRGHADGRRLYGDYSQDHLPVDQQTDAVGHAVRLAYLYSGVMDLVEFTGDTKLADASARVWDDIVRTKMYVTGGVGSQGNNEGFGAPFDLPNSSAYNETCSSIAFVSWSHRMLLATGDARYADVLERTLYNAALAGWSLSGDRFFYPNPLEVSRGRQRSSWFECACCPPNVSRFIAQVPGMAYATRERDVFVNLYMDSRTTAKVGGNDITLTQQTGYPWEGAVTVHVDPAAPSRFDLHLRIPGWARAEAVPSDLYRFEDATPAPPPTLRINGAETPIRLDKGFAVVNREWRAGDRVELGLPMSVQRVVANDRVATDTGRVALQRGPFVYCFEAADQPSPDVLAFVAARESTWTPRHDAAVLGGVTLLTGSVGLAERTADAGRGGTRVVSTINAVAIPYFAWANRTPGAMCVWTAATPAAAKPRPLPTLATRARASSSFGGDVGAIADQLEAKSSGDHDNPFLHWWPRKGTEEWIQYEFAEPTNVSGVEVYWFDDTGRGECRLPESWTLQARVQGAWQDVANPTSFGVAPDVYNRTTFDSVRTDALRIKVRARKNWAGGIHEWRVISGAEQPAASISPNVIPNPSFEQLADKSPAKWSRSTWGGKASLDVAETGRTGARSVMIASRDGADVAWSTTVPVEINARYRLEAWIKTDSVTPRNGGRGALLNLHAFDRVRTEAVTGTADWTRVQVEFDTGMRDAVMINCLFGGWGLATGTAWYDDVSLTLLSRQPAEAPRISIDAGQTGEPINPYIYGQFIEHLGKCIYGGIWAEMLDDRKFYHPVGHAESPWRTVGATSAVAMSAKDPFVGAHSPVVTVPASGAPAGISHAALALKQGASYTGSIWLTGDVPVSVALAWGDAPDQRQTVAVPAAPAFTRTELRFESPVASSAARLEITATRPGSFRVGSVSLMPADNIQGFRPDTLALLKELDSPVYRWPGGNFVSGYDWRDGVGERDRRPPRKNPAWLGVEHNDVGIHEFLDLCALLKTDPYIAVNTGLGSVENAVAELQYVNGAPDTPMGRLRAEHGRTDPWNVKFWGIGNEMYGSWQLGNVPLADYTKRHNTFVDAFRRVDPSITVIGVGAVGEWSRTMLTDCAERLDLLSEHVYWQDQPGLLSHVSAAPRSLKHIADEHRKYRRDLPSLKGKDIRLVQDEWNYWYGPHVFGELGTRYFMKDALGCAAALNEFGRNSDLFYMANYAQTVNVIGAIKVTPTNAALETTGLVLKLYRHHLGVIPCKTESTPTVDALAAWSADRKTLTIGVVNISTQAQRIELDLRGAALGGAGTRREIASTDPMAFNDPDGARPIDIRESPVTGVTGFLEVAPCSVTVFSLPVR